MFGPGSCSYTRCAPQWQCSRMFTWPTPCTVLASTVFCLIHLGGDGHGGEAAARHFLRILFLAYFRLYDTVHPHGLQYTGCASRSACGGFRFAIGIGGSGVDLCAVECGFTVIDSRPRARPEARGASDAGRVSRSRTRQYGALRYLCTYVHIHPSSRPTHPTQRAEFQLRVEGATESGDTYLKYI